jgi:predicted RNA binding protein YcfA (HicA-like mRNA interferase family)
MKGKMLPIPAKKVIQALEDLGFIQIRQKGSHLFMQHPDGRTTVIPIHAGKDIGKGMLRKIINDVKISRDEWINLINSLIMF